MKHLKENFILNWQLLCLNLLLFSQQKNNRMETLKMSF